MALIKQGSLTAAGSRVGFGFQKPPNAASTGEDQIGISTFSINGVAQTAGAFMPLIALQANLSPIASFKDMPPELTGDAYPTDVYKDGQLFGGQITFIPRLVGAFPYILLGAVGWNTLGVTEGSGYRYRYLPPWGSLASTATWRDGTAVASPTAIENAAYKEQYLYPEEVIANGNTDNTVADEKYLPWMQWVIENPNGEGAQGYNALINSLVLTVPQQGPASVRLGVVGKTGKIYDQNASVKPAWIDRQDDFSGTMMALSASLDIDDPNMSGVKFYGVKLSILNNLTGPREEQVMGSDHPDTFTVKRRVVQIETTVKWKDAVLSRLMLSGNTSGETFDPLIDTTDFGFKLDSSYDIGGGTKASLAFKAPKVIWRPNGPIMPDLNGDNIVTQDYVGIVSDDGQHPYFWFDLVTNQYDRTFQDGSSNTYTAFDINLA